MKTSKRLSLDEVLSRASPATRLLNAALSASVPAHGSGQGAVLKRPVRHDPLAKVKTEKGNPSLVLVRVTSYRRRLLDEDNLIPKWHIDFLRQAGVLADDSPAHCHIETRQVKVNSKDKEHTVLEVLPWA